MQNYQVTIGYKAVITFDVKAESEGDAKDEAIKEMNKIRDKIYKGKAILQDDNYKADGILNMDETWNML